MCESIKWSWNHYTLWCKEGGFPFDRQKQEDTHIFLHTIAFLFYPLFFIWDYHIERRSSSSSGSSTVGFHLDNNSLQEQTNLVKNRSVFSNCSCNTYIYIRYISFLTWKACIHPSRKRSFTLNLQKITQSTQKKTDK